MINVEIDGKKITVEPGTSIIEAAERAGVWIPRFCYHKKLSVAANCRMCLVEVEKAPKPLASCATPVAEGMRVFTTSKKALDAQKIVMEFLLINHPLDCPICDQGGECELQDVAMGYGSGVSRYTQGKRAVFDEDLGPLISTDMTRCIHCTRCVRFGEEIAGVRELGLTGRGEKAFIGTYVKHTLSYEMSGNIVDLCPVGALTAKPSRFTVRAWEMKQYPSIAPHDCIGSNIYVHTLRNKVMRVVPRDNETLNETWISDRDRFSYEGLNSERRLRNPLIKKNGYWQQVEWQQALVYVAEGLQKIIEKWGANHIGGLISPNATLEEGYLFQRFLRGLGSHNIDYRLRQVDFLDQDDMAPCRGLGMSLAALQSQDAILLIGSRIQQDVPIISHRIRQAALHGCRVMAVNMLDYDFHFPLSQKCIVSPNHFVETLAGVAKALIAKTTVSISPEMKNYVAKASVSEQHQAMADQLLQAEKTALLLGFAAQQHPQASSIRLLANIIATCCGTHISFITEGANAAGMSLAGCLPHRAVSATKSENAGLNYAGMLERALHAYVLMDIQPDFDCANPKKMLANLMQADFVVALSAFGSDVLAENHALFELADVILPVTPYTETSGTYVNVLGDWQRFQGVCQPQGEARPAWKVLRVLGNLCGLDSFDYTSSEQIHNEVVAFCDAIPQEEWVPRFDYSVVLPTPSDHPLFKVTEVPLYRQDALVRHAPALQKMVSAKERGMRMNAQTAKSYSLKAEECAVLKDAGEGCPLIVFIDETVPDGVVVVSAGMLETTVLGDSFAPVEITTG